MGEKNIGRNNDWELSKFDEIYKNLHIQEVQQATSRLNSKSSTPRNTKVKLSKDKDKENLETAEKQLITYKWPSMRLIADFSSKTMEVRRLSDEIDR